MKYEFDAPDKVMVGVRGEVGARLFLLQARQGRRLVILKCEKLQLAALAQWISQVLDDMGRPGHLPDDFTLEPEYEADYSVGDIAIAIDEERDVISDNGAEVYNFLRYHDIQQVLILGVHTNMCVLRRSFAIKNLVRRGVPVALIRDLTDALYNPALRPYVSHADGTRLVVEYIEKFWCPSIDSADLIEGKL